MVCDGLWLAPAASSVLPTLLWGGLCSAGLWSEDRGERCLCLQLQRRAGEEVESGPAKPRALMHSLQPMSLNAVVLGGCAQGTAPVGSRIGGEEEARERTGHAQDLPRKLTSQRHSRPVLSSQRRPPRALRSHSRGEQPGLIGHQSLCFITARHRLPRSHIHTLSRAPPRNGWQWAGLHGHVFKRHRRS